MSDYAKVNLREVEDQAPSFGLAEMGESRFARRALGAETVGLAYYVVLPGQRQPFGHCHSEDEEIYVVLSGSGRARVGDEIVELGRFDALRVAPAATRAFEAGDDGLELVAFGSHHEGDCVRSQGELLPCGLYPTVVASRRSTGSRDSRPPSRCPGSS